MDAPFEREVASSTPEPGTGQLDPAMYKAGEYQLIVNGGGWGHGVGMSQYGARGAALLGCSYPEILAGFFPKAEVGGTDTSTNVRVGLFPNTPQGGPVTAVGVRNSGSEPLSWQIEGASPPDLAPGATVYVHWEEGGFLFREGEETTSKTIWPADGDPVGSGGTRLKAPLKDTRVHLPAKGMDYSRGVLEFTSKQTSSPASSGMMVVVDVPTIEQYLYGLAEVPSSWGEDAPAALQAQAVAGRSFVANYRQRGAVQHANCACTVYDSTSHQYYTGWSKEAGPGGSYWVKAVNDTVGKVLKWDLYQDGTLDIVPVYYSSSHGGHSSAASDIWNSPQSTAGYLEAVDISRWEQAAPENPYYRWSAGFTTEELAERLGMDSVLSLDVVERAPGGRPCSAASPVNPCSNGEHGLVVTGIRDGEEVRQTYGSEAIRISLAGSPRSRNGLLNGLFEIEKMTLPWQRIQGGTRTETAIRLSKEGWGQGSDTVVLARQDDPADALTGSALAGTHDAPLLLTPQDGLADEVAAELQRLDATTVLLLGGPVALSNQVVADLQQLDIPTITRVEGRTRHGTAVDVARRVDRGEEATAYLVELRSGWVDALSVAGVAARRAGDGTGWPILGTESELPAETREGLRELGITRVVPVGGPQAIPQPALDQLADMGIEVTDRLAGGDRYGTSRAVAATDAPTEQTLVIATGQNFPDGLAAGPYVARTGAALLLVPTDLRTDSFPWREGEHGAFLGSLGWDEPHLVAVGGPVAIASPVISHVATLLYDAAG